MPFPRLDMKYKPASTVTGFTKKPDDWTPIESVSRPRRGRPANIPAGRRLSSYQLHGRPVNDTGEINLTVVCRNGFRTFERNSFDRASSEKPSKADARSIRNAIKL